MSIPHPLSPPNSPKSTYRRSLTMEDPDYPYAYDFPFYSASASSSPSTFPATNAISVPPAFTHHKSPAARSSRANNASVGTSTSRNRIRDTSPSQSPPPSSARFVHGYPITTAYPGTASTSSISSNRVRARGPSFASTTSHASSSTASSSSSSGGPATPPRSGFTLSLSSPTRTFRPYWEKERPHSHLGEDEKCRLDEEAEDVPQDIEEDDSTDEEEFGYDRYRNSRSSFDYSRHASSPLASLSLSSNINRKPPSVRRSPFADTDPAAPYSHVYLDEDIFPQRAITRASSPGARRLSGSGSIRRRTESPSSVVRSVSLSHSHSQSRASPRRPHTAVLTSYSRPQSPALSSHSNSHTPSFEQDPLETSFELDTSPLRTALLLNPDPDGEHDREPHQLEVGRRFSGRGLGLGLGLESVNGSVNVALARRRAEWTEFEGDEYSSTRPVPPFREEEGDGEKSRRGALSLDLTYDGDVDLSSPRPSFSHPYARVASPLGEKRRSYPYAYGGARRTAISDDEGSSQVAEASDKEAQGQEGASEGGSAWNQGEDVHVPTCFAFRWGVRARWAALKLRVRLGAFRARRRLGLA